MFIAVYHLLYLSNLLYIYIDIYTGDASAHPGMQFSHTSVVI